MINPKMLEFIEGLNKDELARLRDEMLNGNLQERVNARISQLEDRQTICPVCSNDPGPAGFTLLFGPTDLRKKATFCGYDCLEYFIKLLKDISHESQKYDAAHAEKELQTPQENTTSRPVQSKKKK